MSRRNDSSSRSDSSVDNPDDDDNAPRNQRRGKKKAKATDTPDILNGMCIISYLRRNFCLGVYAYNFFVISSVT
jgi:hypothetical protein